MSLDFIDLAQNCTDPAEFQAAVLDRFQRTIGFDAGFFLPKGENALLTTVGLDQDVTARLVECGATYARELTPVAQAALCARGVAVDTAVCGLDHVQSTQYFREIAATVNGRHALVAYVPWHGRTQAMLMLGRSGTTFSDEDVALVESSLPGLGVARAALGLARWSPSALPSAPDGLLHRLLGQGRSRVLASVRAGRATIVVRDRNGFREMLARDGTDELVWTRASLKDPSRSGWPYVDLFHLAPALASGCGRALFVGSGGGVSLQQFARRYPAMKLDLVEREPAVLELARDWFALNSVPNLTTHVAEAAAFIGSAPSAFWDLVVVDAFDTNTDVAQQLYGAGVQAIRRVLRPGGATAWNVIGSLSRFSPVANLVSCASRVFDTVRVLPVVDAHEDFAPETVRNVVVVAVWSGDR